MFNPYFEVYEEPLYQTTVGITPIPKTELTIRVGEQVLHARVTRAAVADLGLTTASDIYALVKSVSFDRDA